MPTERQQGNQGGGTATMTRNGNFELEIRYTTPYLAIWQGQFVNILAEGNQEGFSPACEILDQEGVKRIVPTEQVLEVNRLPPAHERVQQLLERSKQQASTARR